MLSRLRIRFVVNAGQMSSKVLFWLFVTCWISFCSLTQGTRQTGSLIVVENSEEDSEKSIDDDKIDTRGKENTEDEQEPFIPTSNWQRVKKDQTIPAGLHVRINLATGEKEAKLLENEDSSKLKQNNKAKLKEYLDNFKGIQDDDMPSKSLSDTEEKRFKSIDQIKKEFQELKMNFKTDYEIMSSLIKELKAENLTEIVEIQIFDSLEFYVHQFDNAQDFVKLDGLQIIIPKLNSSNENVKAAACFLLGSAMQSNPRVQIAALEHGFLQYLLRLIVLDSSYLVQSRTMYAVSCLVRNFPLAQKNFIEQGGLYALATVFQSKYKSTEKLKLQVKAITLIHDLVLEHELAAKNNFGEEIQQEKLRQYKRVPLIQAIVERGWCELILHPLSTTEHDVREKVMKAMLTLNRECQTEFQKASRLLLQMEEEYTELSSYENKNSYSRDSADSYFTGLMQLVEQLLNNLSIIRKDEL